jgi:AraC family transcriptional regulator of adaptative response / methylphosphotriester-DNA alkyltransferase methyltransferase
MKRLKQLSKQQMWGAVENCNSQYDGVFYYAVKTTGIFCRPSCRSKTPVQENVIFFSKSNEAIENRFRPCKRCRPDLIDQAYHPSDDFIHAVQSILESEYASSITLEGLAERVGVSKDHLHRAFKRKVGCTPRVYLENVRIRMSKNLLTKGSLSNTEICFAVGFQSLSQFYSIFRKHTGCSPKQYKKMLHIGASDISYQSMS